MSVFNPTYNDATNENCFFGTPVNVARYDKQRYPAFDKLTQQQLGFFWRPEEIDLSRDSKDFKALTDNEKHIFTSNLKRQILLDSVQGRAPSLAFLPICSLPELETWIQTWAFSETIHSRSYTHIIRNVYSDPSIVFDQLLDIEAIGDCAADISKYYDDLIDKNVWKSDWRADKPYSGSNKIENEYNHKKALWLCLNAVNALEGVRFYVSFACSWAFAEVKKMEGNAKIIKLIARDENVHLAGTQQLIKILPKEDEDFAKIAQETKDECVQIFQSVIDQEKEWAKYLFKDGSMIGLNEQLLCDYVDWIGHKRMAAVGLNGKSTGANPLPWTQKWISGSDVQVAPQETEITSYIIGGVKKDVDSNSFKGFSL
jgi:ribonucleoside-diphosphate reductase beta chain